MITVKITCNTGKTWSTGINADLHGAKAYFLGKIFTDESPDGKETHHTAVAVDIISHN